MPPAPPWPIDLALSGGGFRAAGFHFGGLQVLHEVGLLPHVRAISTVSGGTLVGAAWTLSLAQGEPFETFSDRFGAFLTRNNLANCTLLALLDRPDGREPSLIRAVARVYAEKLLRVRGADGKERPARLGDVFGAEQAPPTICFNTTELYSGTDFRFQRGPGSGLVIGNGDVSIPRDQAEGLRLADIVAASSCFPGGFEPLLLPDDFVAPEGAGAPPVTVRFAGHPDRRGPVALMDGGIYDNQGTESLLLDRAGTGDPPGLLLVSDASPAPPPEGFYEPPPPPRIGGMSVGMAVILASFALLTVIFVLLAQATWVAMQGNTTYAAIDVGLAAIVALIGVGGAYTLNGFYRLVLDHVPPAHHTRLGMLGVNHVLHFLRVRLRSLAPLTTDIFVKRIRRLSYAHAWQDERVAGKVVASLVDDLPDRARDAARLVAAGLPAPTDVVRRDLDVAARMDTTLWWDNALQREAVIRAGRDSMCFNLLDHLLERYGGPADHPPEVAEVFGKLAERWRAANGG